MKKFLLNIITFTLCLMVINALLISMMHRIYLEPYQCNNLDSETYILADSHGMVLGDTTSVGFENYSYASDSYSDIYNKLLYLIRNSNINRAIISVDDHTLSPYRETRNNNDRSFSLSSFDDFRQGVSMFGKFTKRYLVLLNPKFRDVFRLYIQSEIKNLIRPQWKDNVEVFQWDMLPKSKQIQLCDTRYQEQFSFESASNELSKSLTDIIELCDSYNIELIGVKFPLSKSYVDKIGTKSYYADRIFTRNGKQVFDFKEFFINKNSLFHDQDHLNQAGVKEFIGVLSDSIKRGVLIHK